MATRVAARMIATSRGVTIADTTNDGTPGSITIVVPVLDEERRLGPCLDALRAQGDIVREILVIDGGSHDDTRAVVRSAAARDPRIRLIGANATPRGWNGKAWNLETGLSASDPRSRWILMLDADVRPAAGLCRALAAHAQRFELAAFSVATRQRLAGPIDAVLHPSMLATLVYRFGIPGTATTSLSRMQANGQCFFATRDVLVRTAAIAAARDSRSEDVTIARAIAAKDHPVGFYETDGLVTVEMYDDWRALLANWPRSLPMRDRYSRASAWIGMLEVLLVQALPPWIALVSFARAKREPNARPLRDVQIALVAMRIATLAGMRRAYVDPGPAYWLSPLADLPVIALLVASSLRRRHAWRGRTLVAEGAR
jgi:dolichol-phosphate mannosyltransferase